MILIKLLFYILYKNTLYFFKVINLKIILLFLLLNITFSLRTPLFSISNQFRNIFV